MRPGLIVLRVKEGQQLCGNAAAEAAFPVIKMLGKVFLVAVLYMTADVLRTLFMALVSDCRDQCFFVF